MTGGSEVDAGVAVLRSDHPRTKRIDMLAVHLARITRRPPEE
jgi:hypothetical protein